MKSKLDQQIEDTFYYAVNFYSTNDRSIPMQEFCLSQMMLYGLDLDTCIRIQNPIMSVFQMGELMQIGSEITQQHLATITHNIRQHLLGIQSTLKPETVKELPNIQTLGNTGKGSNKRDIDGVSVQVKNIVQDVTINGYQGQKSLIMSNYDLEPHDTNYLSATMPSNTYNFTLVDFSHNSRIEALGLDYLLKGAAGISSIQQGNQNISLMYQGMLTRPSFNIVKLNLENCNIGDIGADIIGHALANGKLPATKHIDISGNNITQTGEVALSEAMKKSLNTNLNIISVKTGWKTNEPNWKLVSKDILKSFLAHAENQGIDTEYVATNKSTLDYIVNVFKMGKNMLFGWGKCSNTLLEILSFDTNAPSITKGFALEMYGTKAMKKVDFHVCMLLEAHDAIVSEEGVELAVKAVDLLGGE